LLGASKASFTGALPVDFAVDSRAGACMAALDLRPDRFASMAFLRCFPLAMPISREISKAACP
jgi:hypothetical protein